MTSVTKKKQEEKHLEILKKLLKIECNKKCFECGERCPTYIDITIGSFVCSSCSGILRGLSTPHRLKSISMSCFTPSEIASIETKGNEYCKNIYLGAYDPRCKAQPKSNNQLKLKMFMEQKYEEKRWYISPKDANQPLESFKESVIHHNLNQAEKASNLQSCKSIKMNNKQDTANNNSNTSNSSIIDTVFSDNNSGFADFSKAFCNEKHDSLDANIFGSTSHPNEILSSGFSYGDNSSTLKSSCTDLNNICQQSSENTTVADKYKELDGLFVGNFDQLFKMSLPSHSSTISNIFNAPFCSTSSVPVSTMTSFNQQPLNPYNMQQTVAVQPENSAASVFHMNKYQATTVNIPPNQQQPINPFLSSRVLPASNSGMFMMPQTGGGISTHNTSTFAGMQQPSNTFIPSQVSSSFCNLQSNPSYQSQIENHSANNGSHSNSQVFSNTASVSQHFSPLYAQSLPTQNSLKPINPFFQPTSCQQLPVTNNPFFTSMVSNPSLNPSYPCNPFTTANNQPANPFF